MTNPRSLIPSRHPASTLTATVAAIAMLGLSGCDEESARPANTPVERELQQVLQRGVTKPGVMLPGAIAHYHDPAYRPWTGAAGLGETGARVAMRPHDRFRAGSVLKTFLATVALQHVEAGTLSLDQTLPALLPADVTARIPQADRISLRMLLGHTSGIPDWVTDEVHVQVVRNPRHVWTDAEALDLAAALPRPFAPGAAWEYSNTNYTIVGMVLDRAGGKSWRIQVRERVLDRLGLTGTRLPEPGDLGITGDFAHGYQDVGGGSIMDLSAIDPSMAGAAGGHALVTTAEDLRRFLDALLAGQLFTKRETLTAMTTMVDAPHESGLPHRYGLGLESFTFPGGGATVIGHAGSTAGYAVMMFRLSGTDTTLVTAVNTHDLFVNALEVFMPAVKVLAEMRQ